MNKIVIVFSFLILCCIVKSQEYKQPTQYYYQSEPTEVSYLALIGGNAALITLGNIVDQRMSTLTPGENQHTNLVLSIIICAGVDYLYLSPIFRNKRNKKNKKSKKNKENTLTRSKF